MQHIIHWYPVANYILLINREWGHYREISDQGLDSTSVQRDRGLRFPCNDQTDEVNKLFIIWLFKLKKTEVIYQFHFCLVELCCTKNNNRSLQENIDWSLCSNSQSDHEKSSSHIIKCDITTHDPRFSLQ